MSQRKHLTAFALLHHAVLDMQLNVIGYPNHSMTQHWRHEAINLFTCAAHVIAQRFTQAQACYDNIDEDIVEYINEPDIPIVQQYPVAQA